MPNTTDFYPRLDAKRDQFVLALTHLYRAGNEYVRLRMKSHAASQLMPISHFRSDAVLFKRDDALNSSVRTPPFYYHMALFVEGENVAEVMNCFTYDPPGLSKPGLLSIVRAIQIAPKFNIALMSHLARHRP